MGKGFAGFHYRHWSHSWRTEVGVHRSTSNDNTHNETEEVLTSLVLFVVLGTWVIRLDFISLALNKEGYFNTEKERLFGSLKWTQPYWDQTVPPGGRELFMLQMFFCGFCRCLIFICYLFKTAHFLGASKLFLLYFFLETSKHQLIEMNFMPALGFSPSKLHIYRE